MLTEPIVAAVTLVIGAVAGYGIRYFVGAQRINSLESKLQEDIRKAKGKAQDIVLEAKEKAVSLLDEAKEEDKSRKASIERLEGLLLKRDSDLSEKEEDLKKDKESLVEKTKDLQEAIKDIDTSRERIKTELTKVSGLSPDKAKEELIKEIEDEHKDILARKIGELSREREDEIEKKSLEIMTTAIQRYARTHIAETTTSTFTLPSEDLKGKIIGREGRNIRTLERLTGTELIIDETPETIIISSFDPLRREVASLALAKLIKDGRIQPAKIEEKVNEARSELDKRMHEIGEEAAYEIGIYDFPKEIIQLLGRLHFRTSFGQNVLTHSIEMAHLSGMMASELGANADIAKRGALVHDIGKAIDHDVPGTHVDLGRKILKKYGVAEEVMRAMETHHEEYPFSTPESYIVTAADALSAARPGARRGTLENYVKRLEDLEKVAMDFPGVKKAYAIAAGRELRVFVVPEKVDDFRALQLARDIAAKIASDLQFPGEIKVNVIREMRAVEYAR